MSAKCAICGKDVAAEVTNYPATIAKHDDCPANHCRYCWYALGRAVPTPKQEYKEEDW